MRRLTYSHIEDGSEGRPEADAEERGGGGD